MHSHCETWTTQFFEETKSMVQEAGIYKMKYFSGYLSKGDYHEDLFHFWSKHTNVMTEYVLA